MAIISTNKYIKWLILVATGLVLTIVIILCLNHTSRDPLVIAAGTTLENSGFLDHFIPIFEDTYGIDVEIISVGSGQAIELAKNGDVDLLFIHSPDAEIQFVKVGFGILRQKVMHNNFYLVGPKSMIGEFENSNATSNIYSAFQKIHDGHLPFLSRGDYSGTHIKELEIWTHLNIVPDDKSYSSIGKGMSSVLEMANELGGLTLVDRGTFLMMKSQLDLQIITRDDAHLINQYSVVSLSPSVNQNLNVEAANQFISWLLSENIQKEIGEFGVDQYGEAVYFPDGVK